MTNIGNYISLAEPVSSTVPTEEAQLTFEKGRERGWREGRQARQWEVEGRENKKERKVYKYIYCSNCTRSNTDILGGSRYR